MERIREIYLLRAVSGSNGTLAVPSSPLVPIPTLTPEQLRGNGDALGENQHYQSIHDGAFKDYYPIPCLVSGADSSFFVDISGKYPNGWEHTIHRQYTIPPFASNNDREDYHHPKERRWVFYMN